MSYAQGGIIAAADYNGFVGTSPSSTANTVNTVWAIGNSQYGYGQTAISQVSSTGLITATQWATVVNTLNSIRIHQTGSGTGIGAPTAGTLIAYLSTFSTGVNSAYSSQTTAAFNAQGSTVTGSNFASPDVAANQSTAVTSIITRTATFASADQARYFFNAGGQLNFVIGSSTNNDGTARSGDLVTLASTNFVSYPAFRALTGGGKSGTGGTVNTNVTNIGYYGLTTSNQTLTKITSTTSGYASDYIQLDTKYTGTTGANGDKSTQVTFYLTLFSAARSTLPAPPANPPGTGTTTTNTIVNDSINVTINNRIDVVYPETTNLSNVWGAVTIG